MTMKTLKCPLCGNEPAIKYTPSQRYRAGCYHCGRETYKSAHSREGALETAEKFMAKIPSSLRVREGDSLLMRFGEETRNVKITAIINTVLFETGEGIIFPDNVEQWPWELKQKGETDNDV